MKIVAVGILFMCFVIPAQLKDTERYAYCESCLIAAREIEMAMKEAPAGNRLKFVDTLISGSVCEKMPPSKLVSQEKLRSSCISLLEAHYDPFHAVLVNEKPKSFEIALCYEQSTACVGVKRSSFEDAKKATFTDRHIKSLLDNNKGKVRVAHPVHSGVPVHSDEL